MKKALLALAAAFILLACCAASAYALELTAKSAILVDAANGKVLYSQNPDEQLPVASTTKVLTALIVLENVSDLKQTVTLPDDFVNVGESGIYLQAGETHTYEDLLYAMLLRSANDAAQALAISVAGSEEAFVDLMNQRSRELGLQNSHWANPHGLEAEGHYSCARDLAVIAREALKNEVFNTIVSTYSWTIPWENNEYDRVVYNHNQFLSSYEGADGVKTGYTSQAGNCLISSATRNGMRLIGVVLNCADHYSESAELLDYGFENFSRFKVADKGEVVGSVKVSKGRQGAVDAVVGEDIYVVMPNGSTYSPEYKLELPASIAAPFSTDQAIGKIAYDDGEGNFAEADLFPAVALDKYTFGSVWLSFWRHLWGVFL
ncbi:MAG: D-alanyl-D-alanine carboxypeptidase [Firmicutes bacterium]|nr:D-alanyl-D-alanine carboxypeptidase [Bacillota bacterium]